MRLSNIARSICDMHLICYDTLAVAGEKIPQPSYWLDFFLIEFMISFTNDIASSRSIL
jgi:hypothetical protein